MIGLVTEQARQEQALVEKRRKAQSSPGDMVDHAEAAAVAGMDVAAELRDRGHGPGCTCGKCMTGKMRGHEGQVPGDLMPPKPVSPAEYRRPYVEDGHAVPSNQHGGPNTAFVPAADMAASQFTRGGSLPGHAERSPAGGGKGAVPVEGVRGREGLGPAEMMPPRPISPSEYRRPYVTEGNAVQSHQYEHPDHGHVPGPLVNAPVDGYPPLPDRADPAAVRGLGSPLGISGEGPIVNTVLAHGGRHLMRPPAGGNG